MFADGERLAGCDPGGLRLIVGGLCHCAPGIKVLRAGPVGFRAFERCRGGFSRGFSLLDLAPERPLVRVGLPERQDNRFLFKRRLRVDLPDGGFLGFNGNADIGAVNAEKKISRANALTFRYGALHEPAPHALKGRLHFVRREDAGLQALGL